MTAVAGGGIGAAIAGGIGGMAGGIGGVDSPAPDCGDSSAWERGCGDTMAGGVEGGITMRGISSRGDAPRRAAVGAPRPSVTGVSGCGWFGTVALTG